MSASIADPLGRQRSGSSASPWLRGRVWLRRASLDRMLAEGADPSASPALRLRAAQLASPRSRGALAAGLERVVDDAEQPARGLTSAVPLQRREILAARADLVSLARDVIEADAPQAHGLALVARLLTDGGSPLYAPRPERSLEQELSRARSALLLR